MGLLKMGERAGRLDRLFLVITFNFDFIFMAMDDFSEDMPFALASMSRYSFLLFVLMAWISLAVVEPIVEHWCCYPAKTSLAHLTLGMCTNEHAKIHSTATVRSCTTHTWPMWSWIIYGIAGSVGLYWMILTITRCVMVKKRLPQYILGDEQTVLRMMKLHRPAAELAPQSHDRKSKKGSKISRWIALIKVLNTMIKDAALVVRDTLASIPGMLLDLIIAPEMLIGWILTIFIVWITGILMMEIGRHVLEPGAHIAYVVAHGLNKAVDAVIDVINKILHIINKVSRIFGHRHHYHVGRPDFTSRLAFARVESKICANFHTTWAELTYAPKHYLSNSVCPILRYVYDTPAFVVLDFFLGWASHDPSPDGANCSSNSSDGFCFYANFWRIIRNVVFPLIIIGPFLAWFKKPIVDMLKLALATVHAILYCIWSFFVFLVTPHHKRVHKKSIARVRSHLKLLLHSGKKKANKK